MSNYYDEVKRANVQLRDMISMMQRSKIKTHSLNKLVLTITEQYSVSEKHILKRLEKLALDSGDFEVKGDKVVFFVSGDDEE